MSGNWNLGLLLFLSISYHGIYRQHALALFGVTLPVPYYLQIYVLLYFLLLYPWLNAKSLEARGSSIFLSGGLHVLMHGYYTARREI